MSKWWIMIILLSMGLTACGGSLGRLRLEDVDASLRDAEGAIQNAQHARSSQVAQPMLRQAEQLLDNARQARAEKRGMEAIRLAYSAASMAQLAESQALQETSTQQQVAQLRQENERFLRATQAQLDAAQTESERARRDMRRFENEAQQLRQEKQRLDETLAAKHAAESQAQQASNALSQVETSLDRVQQQLDQARAQQYLAENQVAQLALRLNTQVSDGELVALQATEQARETERKASAMAHAYSAKLDRAKQERDLATAEARARQYAAQKKQAMMVDYTVAIPQDAREKLDAWQLTWVTQDIDSHLAFYVPDVRAEQITVQQGRETSSGVDSRTVFADLRRLIQQRWTKTGAQSGRSVDAVVGRYQFTQAIAGTSLYTIWDRESHWQQRNGRWQIVREIWRLYERVPRYPRQPR